MSTFMRGVEGTLSFDKGTVERMTTGDKLASSVVRASAIDQHLNSFDIDSHKEIINLSS